MFLSAAILGLRLRLVLLLLFLLLSLSLLLDVVVLPPQPTGRRMCKTYSITYLIYILHIHITYLYVCMLIIASYSPWLIHLVEATVASSKATELLNQAPWYAKAIHQPSNRWLKKPLVWLQQPHPAVVLLCIMVFDMVFYFFLCCCKISGNVRVPEDTANYGLGWGSYTRPGAGGLLWWVFPWPLVKKEWWQHFKPYAV